MRVTSGDINSRLGYDAKDKVVGLHKLLKQLNDKDVTAVLDGLKSLQPGNQDHVATLLNCAVGIQGNSAIQRKAQAVFILVKDPSSDASLLPSVSPVLGQKISAPAPEPEPEPEPEPGAEIEPERGAAVVNNVQSGGLSQNSDDELDLAAVGAEVDTSASQEGVTSQESGGGSGEGAVFPVSGAQLEEGVDTELEPQLGAATVVPDPDAQLEEGPEPEPEGVSPEIDGASLAIPVKKSRELAMGVIAVNGLGSTSRGLYYYKKLKEAIKSDNPGQYIKDISPTFRDVADFVLELYGCLPSQDGSSEHELKAESEPRDGMANMPQSLQRFFKVNPQGDEEKQDVRDELIEAFSKEVLQARKEFLRELDEAVNTQSYQDFKEYYKSHEFSTQFIGLDNQFPSECFKANAGKDKVRQFPSECFKANAGKDKVRHFFASIFQRLNTYATAEDLESVETCLENITALFPKESPGHADSNQGEKDVVQKVKLIEHLWKLYQSWSPPDKPSVDTPVNMDALHIESEIKIYQGDRSYCSQYNEVMKRFDFKLEDSKGKVVRHSSEEMRSVELGAAGATEFKLEDSEVEAVRHSSEEMGSVKLGAAGVTELPTFFRRLILLSKFMGQSDFNGDLDELFNFKEDLQKIEKILARDESSHTALEKRCETEYVAQKASRSKGKTGCCCTKPVDTEASRRGVQIIDTHQEVLKKELAQEAVKMRLEKKKVDFLLKCLESFERKSGGCSGRPDWVEARSPFANRLYVSR